MEFIAGGSNVVDAPPEIIIPEGGGHLWEWYFDMSARLVRTQDFRTIPIPPSEWVAWEHVMDVIVYPSEYAILSAMDVAFCGEMNKELADFQAREEERAGKR